MTQVGCSLGTRSCTCVGCCTPDCSHHRHASLKELADDYVEVFRPRLACSLGWFGNVSCIEEAIQRSALSRMCDDKMHPHQRRVGGKALAVASKRLKPSATDIASARSFQRIISIVEEVAGPVERIGTLANYDIALRIGKFKGLKPKEVYLHAGARKGAMALDIPLDRVVPLTSLPAALQHLEPYEIEDFLCIYKDCLTRLPKAQKLVA